MRNRVSKTIKSMKNTNTKKHMKTITFKKRDGIMLPEFVDFVKVMVTTMPTESRDRYSKAIPATKATLEQYLRYPEIKGSKSFQTFFDECILSNENYSKFYVVK